MQGDDSQLGVLVPEPHAVVSGKGVAEDGHHLREPSRFNKSLPRLKRACQVVS